MVFAKSTCSFCKSSRALLKTMKATIDFEVSITELDLMLEEDGPLIQMELLQTTGEKLVPYVFIGSKFVGGNKELQKLVASGSLQELLTDVVNSRSSVIRANYLRETIAGNEPSIIL
jgi:glutaredoxin